VRSLRSVKEKKEKERKREREREREKMEEIKEGDLRYAIFALKEEDGSLTLNNFLSLR